jgi:regulator of replication initiation timing
MKTMARAFDDVTGNNNNVQTLDEQLQGVQGEYQQRLEESVAIRAQLTVGNAALQAQLANANNTIVEKDRAIASKDAIAEEREKHIKSIYDNVRAMLLENNIKKQSFTFGEYVGQMDNGNRNGFGTK